jgi:hypothetical protein
VNVNDVGSFGASVPTVQRTALVHPDADDTNDSAAGSVSAIVTLDATDGPWLVTATV